MSHLYYWGAAIFIAAIIGFYGCCTYTGTGPIDKIRKALGLKPTITAMCYSVAAPTSHVHTCPICGKSTSLVPSTATEVLNASYRLEFFYKELQTTGTAPDWTIEFDKTQFCDNCTPGRTAPPKLTLIVNHKDKEEPHEYEGITYDDLRLILDFLQTKKERYDLTTRAMRPMEDYHKRLNELLGLSLQTDEKTGTTTND